MSDLAKRVSQQYAGYFRQHQARMAADAITPTILYIGCVDSRLDPEAILQVAPGDMFVLRVPGGIVPAQGLGDVCVAGAIELILDTGSIKHVVACAHSHCAFLGKVATGVEGFSRSSLSRLVSMADFARSQASTQADRVNDPASFQHALLEAFVQRNLQALREIRLVKEKEAAGEITLHSWYFDLEKGQIVVYDETTKRFMTMGTAVEEETTAVSSSPPQETAEPIETSPAPSTTTQPEETVVPPTPSSTAPPMGTQPSPLPRPLAPRPIRSSSPLQVPKKPTVSPPAKVTENAASEAVPVPSVAPTPVKVPSAAPVQRVYPEEVTPADDIPEPTQPPPDPSPRDRLKLELRDLLAGMQMPAKRLQLRRTLNQMTKPAHWQLVQEVVQEANDPQLGHSLRQLSIELSRSEARRELRKIISQVEASQQAHIPSGDWQQVQQEFLDVLKGLVTSRG